MKMTDTCYSMRVILFSISLFVCSIIAAQQPAFPTAEGAGKFVTGGRGTASVATTVFEVTSLADDGSVGTLRYALTNNSPTATYRTIVFRVSGTIRLLSELKVTRANTTIAGQTAPGDGICIADYPFTISADNVIIRYLRFRLGDKNQLITTPANCGVPVAPFNASCMPVNGSGGGDAFGGTYRNNIIIDHCTMSWSNDEACSVYGGTNTTLQWNFFTEPLNYSYHFETGDTDFERHGYGGIQGGASMSIHHNLYAHLQGRVPRFDGSRNIAQENADFRNNVLYNWGIYNTNGGEGGNYNIVNNYYKYGPSTSTGSSSGVPIRFEIINPYKQTSAPVLPYGKYFMEGNYVDGSAANTARNWLGAAMNGGSYADTTSAKVTTPFNIGTVTTHTALQAYDLVLANAGANLPKRDTLDQRIVNDVKNRAGQLIDVQGGFPHGTPFASTVNAWPTLNNIAAPVDTDKDGMPDTWENARGLNPNNATDRNGYNVNGYTNLENYLNGDSIVAKGVNNTCIASRAFISTNGGGWIHACDTTSSILISTDTLNLFASIRDVASYGRFNASYYVINTTRTLSNGKPLLNRNVTIVPSSAITTPVTVRLYFTATEYNTLRAADASIVSLSDLRVLRRSDNTCTNAISGYPEVIVPTASGSFGTYNDGYFVEFTTTALGTFFIAGSTAVVPLKLLSFNATNQNQQNKITWSTSNEINSKQFIVEKSTNGFQFSSLANVPAQRGNGVNQYQYLDAQALLGTVYYRLRIEDMDGSFSYSPIVKVDARGVSSLSLYPNPVIHQAILSHPLAAMASSIELLTADGRTLRTIQVQQGSQQTLIDVSELPVGNYLIRFKNQGISLTTKLLRN